VVGFLPEYYTDHTYVGNMRSATKLGLVDKPARLPDNIALIQKLVEEGRLVLTPPMDYDVRKMPHECSINVQPMVNSSYLEAGGEGAAKITM
jgi:hypothetical protein